nr:immunoglobulin heavy chain junction region [Macaca mulatta]MOW79607.1 immunoglobulin heavy chain junction region [Macaca mulatta]MOW80690.1 immunoglobulin heavy chain junction region [Macaca mulatta]MOW84470.1 immunoglobulin heavy chain junction region [Macaca mulatta]MOW85799.1 immunoglobulin heavy chain junction region [Macaca mulatta]
CARDSHYVYFYYFDSW